MRGPIWSSGGPAHPILAVALHDGQLLHPDLLPLLALDEDERRREEDPYTGAFARAAPSWLAVRRSRFEVDMNRPRERCVYLDSSDAWDRHVWIAPPAAWQLARARAQYDAFYDELYRRLRALERRYGRFVVYDVHSYNHRRDGPLAAPEPPELNPEVNLGTGSLDRDRWARVVERFVAEVRRSRHFDRALDVRENVRFQGGHLARWVHATFPSSGCVLAIEIKKFFMDEWTGRAFPGSVPRVRALLASTLPGVRAALLGEPTAVARTARSLEGGLR